MMVFETRGSNGHLDNDDSRVGEAARVVGAERGLSATAHLSSLSHPNIRARVETSESRKEISFSSFILHYPVRSIHKDRGSTQSAAGYAGVCVGPGQSISLQHNYWGGGHESAFISCTKRLIYFSQGIKGHCKNALCSLSNIKRVRQHKRIPVDTGSGDRYRTSRQRKEKQAVQSERKSWLGACRGGDEV